MSSIYDGILFTDVLEAARSLATQAEHSAVGLHGWWRSWEVPAAVAGQLGVTSERRGAGTSREHAAVARFDSQASRAFSKLAEDGTLVKVGRNQRSPHGSVLGNEAEFYTPAAYEQAVRDRDAREAQEQADRRRWEAVWDALTAAGLDPRHPRGAAPALSLDSWEQLMGLGEGS